MSQAECVLGRLVVPGSGEVELVWAKVDNKAGWYQIVVELAMPINGNSLIERLRDAENNWRMGRLRVERRWVG